MFKPLQAPENTVSVTINDQPVNVESGISVAAALLQNKHIQWRDNTVSGITRGPFCMIGNCFDCLVTINDKPNQQACRVRVADGMRIAIRREA